jgi:hypothetical protein
MRFTRPLHRRLLFLACSLALFFLALTPSQAGGGSGNGCPTPGDGIVYYSDATYTEEVAPAGPTAAIAPVALARGRSLPTPLPSG